MLRLTSLALAIVLLAACGGPPPSPPPAAPGPDAAPAAPVTAASAAPAASTAASDPAFQALLAAADVNKGKVLYLQCRACHSLVPESEAGKIGPTLYGVIGRAAGGVPGFSYSEAIMKSGITWTPEQIDDWLERPSEFLPGNKMVFVGVQNPQERANIIAFIQAESAKPATP
jgi:cytochrome c